MSRPGIAAYELARYWAEGRRVAAAGVLERSLAAEVQEHLEHGADAGYLRLVLGWSALNHPDCQSVGLMLAFPGVPQPAVPVVGGVPCACRGGAVRRGAPVPEGLREAVRSRGRVRPSAARTRPRARRWGQAGGFGAVAGAQGAGRAV